MLVWPAAAPALEILPDDAIDPFATTPIAEIDPFATAAPVADTDTVASVDPFATVDPFADASTVPDADAIAAVATGEYDLYLDISINGIRRNKIIAIHQEADGNLSVTPEDLADIGLLAPGPEVRLPNARIALASLPDVTYVFDATEQTINFIAPEAARTRLIVDANGGDERGDDDESAPPDGRSSDFGVLINYDVYASASIDNTGTISSVPLSGTFAARTFGPFGLVEQTFSLLSDPFKFRRLDTTWSFSDPGAMRTFRAGDVVTGALSWTRPTRLGGVQVQNDFDLRSDIVTHPVPSISGSAALPSTVDIYINNTNRYSGEVPEGPFDIVDVPVLTGAGTIELVVRDVSGKEVTTTADYFTSPHLLSPGLFDYSAEIGFARTHFGSDGDGYDRRLMGSASIRGGVTDWLTWEGHAEGGMDLLNAGTGVVMALGRLGIGQFSVSGSKTAEAMGLQLTGSVQLGFGDMTVGARAQKSFGRYEDIASLTMPGITDHHSATPSSLYQLSLSLPTPFEGARANLSYTQLDPASGHSAQIIAASYGQQIFEGSASATAYMDLKSRKYGLTMNLSMPLGGDISSRTSARHGSQGTSLTADVGYAGGNAVGDLGWLVRVDQDDTTKFSASARTKLPAAAVRARLKHDDKRTGASAEIRGAVVAAGGGIFLANSVEDAFAIVDAGAPGVPVLYQNRVMGITGGDGKLIVPGLSAYEKNRISIDPTKLPLDKIVENTSAMVSPARGSGVVVTFGNRGSGGTALVSFRDPAGEYLPLASSGTIGADAPEFVVGYDGEALLEGLGAENTVTITLPNGSACIADVPYADQGTALVSISDVVCQPV
jgi:outer membrane usher protein